MSTAYLNMTATTPFEISPARESNLAAMRNVNNRPVTGIHGIVLAVIAHLYLHGGYPVKRIPNTCRYNMDTTLLHIEFIAPGGILAHTCTAAAWLLNDKREWRMKAPFFCRTFRLEEST